MRCFESLSHVLANVATGWRTIRTGGDGVRKPQIHRSSRQRHGGAMTVLVVVVLAAAMAGLTMAATSIVTARTEQLRLGRAGDIQRMLDAGRQWIQAGGLTATQDATAEPGAISVQLPSFADEAEASSPSKIEKVLEIQAEPDNQIRMTAKLQRIRGEQTTVLATRTIRFANELVDNGPRDRTSDAAADSSQPNADNSESVGSDADETDFNGDN